MIKITDKKDCCGCSACVQRCPKQCISLHEDEEGFLYPVVDKEVCTQCGLCEKVCPIIHQEDSHEPLASYIAINRDEAIRLKSSSGGIFTLLAEAVIREGGVVFGARFDEAWNVVHDWTDTVDGLAPFRGSKYVQSRIGDTYREAKEFLKQGRKVLFSGTPCQVAGLKRFLRKENDNLLAIDFICHGVPSPGVWQRYLSDFCASISSDEIPMISGVSFRDKRNGWKKYNFCLRYTSSSNSGEQEFIQPFMENPFMRGFLADIYLRPSCYACPAKSGKSGSDITIADAWGINKLAIDYDDDKGACYVLENTDKGSRSLQQLAFESYSVDMDNIKSYNPSYCSSSRPHSKRFQFFKLYTKGTMPIIIIVQKFLSPNCFRKIVQELKNSLYSIKKSYRGLFINRKCND